MEPKIIFSGQTKTGKKYFIRYPQEGDMQAMMEYINKLSKEQTFIRYQGEVITSEEETKFLSDQIKKINKNLAVQLLAICEDVVIGSSAINLKDKTESHEGSFGITLAQDIRGQGIGTTLMDLVLKEAEVKIPQLKLITLSVFGNNPIAQAMYKKFGFKEFGRLPEGILHNGQYVDHIYMYKKIG